MLAHHQSVTIETNKRIRLPRLHVAYTLSINGSVTEGFSMLPHSDKAARESVPHVVIGGTASNQPPSNWSKVRPPPSSVQLSHGTYFPQCDHADEYVFCLTRGLKRVSINGAPFSFHSFGFHSAACMCTPLHYLQMPRVRHHRRKKYMTRTAQHQNCRNYHGMVRCGFRSGLLV
jgi:hypothetical protein